MENKKTKESVKIIKVLALEEIKEEICDKYCRYSNNIMMMFYPSDMEKICNECPLNRL